MTQRERYRRTAEFDHPDRTFLLPTWAWPQTIERWENEGMPKQCDINDFFKTDKEIEVPLAMQGKYGPHLHPQLTPKILSEEADHIVILDEEGNTVRLRRDDPMASMPQWLGYPMKDRNDWETIIKPRVNAAIPGRRPEGKEWDDFIKTAKESDAPIGVWAGSLYGWPRSWMGVEAISYAFADDPMLVHEMCEHIADFVIDIMPPILKDVKLDFAYIWEDMAGKGGPLCSPSTYREFMGGPLRRITDMLHSHGVHTIIVDSDGQNEPLIPVWLDLGVTGLRPFEIAAGCDPIATRKKYGKNLIIQGGIDKRQLSKDFAAIEKEVLSKVPWMCMQGGYFPQVDHLTPPDVSFKNYCYYIDLLRRVVQDPERYYHVAQQKGYAVD